MAADKIEVRFFRTAAGNEPVREWLKNDLGSDERAVVGLDLMRVQYRWPVGMPLCRPLGRGLWEVRSTLPGHRIARVIFCQHGDLLVALHGFIKKTQATPKADIELALKRSKELGDHD